MATVPTTVGHNQRARGGRKVKLMTEKAVTAAMKDETMWTT